MSIESVIVYGTSLGAVYALLALGYSLVYGVGKVMNLAHGAFYVLTGFLIFWIIEAGLPHIHAVIIAIIIITLIGGLVYLILIKPLQNTALGVLIVTFALAIFIEELITLIAQELYTGEEISLPIMFPQKIVILGQIIQLQDLIKIISSVIIVFAFIIFINKTKVGNSIRAVSQDREAAELMRINVNNVILYTLLISSFLVALAAAINISSVSSFEGFIILTYSFSVVILGGLGSLTGSLIGSFILSYAYEFVYFYIDPGFVHLVPVIIIVIILIIKPSGLFGKKERS